MVITVTLHFTKGYIGHPYWPERERLINLQKESGVNRVRSQEARTKTLDAFLQSRHLTMEDYRALEARANRPFYTRADVGLAGDPDEIVIPAHQLHGMLAQAAALAPSSVRLAPAQQIRTLATFGDLTTGRTKPDGVWDRFVVVKTGTGKTLSNQRSLRSDPYLAEFSATGPLRLVNDDAAARAREFLIYCGREIGVGAARKLGWGRFDLAAWSTSSV